jgi:hypothetical protein
MLRIRLRLPWGRYSALGIKAQAAPIEARVNTATVATRLRWVRMVRRESARSRFETQVPIWPMPLITTFLRLLRRQP